MLLVKFKGKFKMSRLENTATLLFPRQIRQDEVANDEFADPFFPTTSVTEAPERL